MLVPLVAKTFGEGGEVMAFNSIRRFRDLITHTKHTHNREFII